jgi:flagellar hook-length control protein FliK
MISLETLEAPTKIDKTKTSKTDATSTETSFEELLKGTMQKGWSVSKDGIVALENDPNATLLQGDELSLEETKKELLTLLQPKDEEETKNTSSSLLELLKSTSLDNSDEETLKLPFSLNPEVSQKLSTDDLKYLVYKAKQYLKNKIATHPEFKNLNMEEFPKTLKGLVAVAKELNIDVTKITYDTIKTQTPTDESSDTVEGDPLLDELLKKPKEKIQKVATQQDTMDVEAELDYQNRLLKAKDDAQLSKVKDIPIIKENTKIASDSIVTTKQLMETKSLTNQTQNEKSEKNDPLKTLLSTKTDATGEKSSLLFDPKILNEQKTTQQQANLFDAIKQTQEKFTDEKNNKESNSSFESLLKGDAKTNDIATAGSEKNNALEVKMQEAKQMMRYLSQDIKKAIDDYKPPFTRVKVTLNPQKLGEVDMTVVQRGNNVHINLSSNNAALNILTSNLNELKTQLNQNGINNASFNFNSQGQNESRQEQRRQKQAQTYASNEIDDDFSDTISSLEIIIPKYI